MLVNRNPFAREELHRKSVDAKPGGCDFCGNTNAKGRLFVYSTESDGGRVSEHKGEFCSKSCHDAYHGL